MTQSERTAATPLPMEPYAVPELNVHGTVSDLTAGTQGRVPDGATAGSSLPNDTEVA